MIKFEINRLTRYLVIKTAHDAPANQIIWSTNEGYVLFYNLFTGRLSVLEAYAVKQGLSLDGITQSKINATNMVVSNLMTVAGGLLGYASFNSYADLEGEVDFKEGTVRNQPDAMIGQTADRIFQLATTEMAKPVPPAGSALKHLSVFCKQPVIDALEAAADAYDLLVAAPLNARNNRKDITSSIKPEIERIDRIIETGLLAVGRQFSGTSFYQTLLSASEIINTGSRKQAAATPSGTTPPPA